jgi:hypothetical protein
VSTQPLEPYAELKFDPHELLSGMAAADAAVGYLPQDPERTITNAAMAYRMHVISQVRRKMITDPMLLNDGTAIRQFLDLVWRRYVPVFRRVTGPMLFSAYFNAFRQVKSREIDRQVINALAEQHAERLGNYFNKTSNEALLQGFNTLVNRKVPVRMALERALDAYGLTPRQMNGYTSLKAAVPVNSAAALDPKASIKAYITRSLRQRLDIFSTQETHNLHSQAQQIVWMYMVESGEISDTAEKMWITMKDELVCPVCGPLHRRKVQVDEPFITEDGMQFWVPGAHVNCRCIVRLMEPTLHLVGKAMYGISYFDESEHPRANDGTFTDKPKPKKLTTLERSTTLADQEFKARVQAVKAKDDYQAFLATQVEAPTLTATPTLTGATLSAGTGLSAGVLSARPEQSLTAPVQTAAQTLTAPVLTAPMISSMLSVNPALNVETVTEMATRAVSVGIQPQTHRRTEKFQGTYPIGHNVYHYPRAAQYSEVPDRYAHFNKVDEWYADPKGVVSEAVNDISSDVAEVAQDVVDDGIPMSVPYGERRYSWEQDVGDPENKLQYVAMDDNHTWIELYEEEVYPLINEAVFKTLDEHDQEHALDIEVMRLEHGRVVGDQVQMTPSEIAARFMGIHQDQFKKAIYRASYAHDQAYEEMDSESRGQYQTFSNSGRFAIQDVTSDTSGDDPWGLINWVDVYPDAPIEEYEVPDE